jgi:hypothetical protein
MGGKRDGASCLRKEGGNRGFSGVHRLVAPRHISPRICVSQPAAIQFLTVPPFTQQQFSVCARCSHFFWEFQRLLVWLWRPPQPSTRLPISLFSLLPFLNPPTNPATPPRSDLCDLLLYTRYLTSPICTCLRFETLIARFPFRLGLLFQSVVQNSLVVLEKSPHSKRKRAWEPVEDHRVILESDPMHGLIHTRLESAFSRSFAHISRFERISSSTRSACTPPPSQHA